MLKRRRAIWGLALGLAAGAVGGWVIRAAAQDERRTWKSQEGQAFVRLPEFIWKALASPASRKAALWTGTDGQILRYSVHVDRAGLPDWIHAMADERIGKGEDLDYEVEIYPDGSQVYEIYRKVGGLEKQLSATAERRVYYVGVEQAPDKLPEAVSTALQDQKGLKVETCILKEGPDVAEYHLKATRDGMPCRLRVSKAGTLIAVQRRVPAEIEVPVGR
jgi:hypothetical protein